MEKCKYCVLKSESVLAEILNSKVDELAKVSEEDKIHLDSKGCDIMKAQERVKVAINNVPSGFKRIVQELNDSMENLVDQHTYEQGYFCEKYFKEGVKCGIEISSIPQNNKMWYSCKKNS